MKKDKQQSSFVNIGSSSLLIIFLILSLVTFAILSLSGAKSDYSFSQRLANHKTAYYEASNRAERILGQIDEALLEKGLDVMYMMLTNIIEETTELLCVGNNARGIVTTAFDLPDAIEDIVLKGVVSRKKQLIPAIVVSLQN